MTDDLDNIYGTRNPPGVFDSGEIKQVETHRLEPNPFQPRKSFNQASLERLGHSLKQEGFIQPIRATTRPGNRIVIATGERRWRAAQIAGLTTVPCILEDLTDAQLQAYALDENILREDLHPVDEAYAIKAYMEKHGLDAHAMAQERGYDHTTVLNRLLLIQYDAIVEAVVNERLTPTHGTNLARYLKRCLTIDQALHDRILADVAAGQDVDPADMDRLISLTVTRKGPRSGRDDGSNQAVETFPAADPTAGATQTADETPIDTPSHAAAPPVDAVHQTERTDTTGQGSTRTVADSPPLPEGSRQGSRTATQEPAAIIGRLQSQMRSITELLRDPQFADWIGSLTLDQLQEAEANLAVLEESLQAARGQLKAARKKQNQIPSRRSAT
jgi:ParB/RepB/Spo0J family partition protein